MEGQKDQKVEYGVIGKHCDHYLDIWRRKREHLVSVKPFHRTVVVVQGSQRARAPHFRRRIIYSRESNVELRGQVEN